MLLFFGCSNLDERHVFKYTIGGTAEYVENMRTVMGPGLDWSSNDTVDIPLEITHDVYGEQLDYKFEVEHSDSNANVIIKVFIDDELMDEKSVFKPVNGTNKIIISGVFIAN
jgi:hypothetical protein